MAGLYVDATSGGMALQIILSGLVGGIVVVKLFWHNLVSTLFFWKKKAPASDQATSETETASS
jgi:hypothetical protein